MSKNALTEFSNTLIEALTVVNRLNKADYISKDELSDLLSGYCRGSEMNHKVSRDEFETLYSLREYLHDIIVDFAK